MSNSSVLNEILDKIKARKVFIAFVGVVFAALFFLIAFLSKPIYTSRATLFPLNNTPENSMSTANLGTLLGITTNSVNSFSNEAQINIIELAQSRNVRESVVAVRLPQFQDKTIAQLLIENYNQNVGIFGSKINIASDTLQTYATAADILKTSLDATVNKNGVLELYFNNNNLELVKPISEVIIAKISQFYIDLRTQKAQRDYAFINQKIDSFDVVINRFDKSAIQLDKTTLFTPEVLQYTIPKDNIAYDKTRLLRQRDAAIASRDEALWRLQKATPIIATLDKPNPPFDVTKKSVPVWMLLGFILGIVASLLILVRKPVLAYIKEEISASLS